MAVGDRVRLVELPDWLIHDLPASEQEEMRGFLGKEAVVSEIDAYGYLWVDFHTMVEDADGAHCSGHSLGVPRECLELVV